MASNVTVQSVIAEISQGHLECPICCERFKQPKLLECSHSFCLECLQQLTENSPSTTTLLCPVCRQETFLKENGIDGLTTDFKSISLMGAFEEQETKLKQQQRKQVPSQEFVSKCTKHTDKDLILYCETCKKLICTTCIAKDHRMHPVMELEEASDQSKQHATELLAAVRQSIKSFNIAIQEIDMSRRILDSMFAATKEKIFKKADEEITKKVARITGEEQKLMQEAEQIYKDRVKTMETVKAINSKKITKAEHKQDEINQLMDQGIKIVYHIEQLLQDLNEYREMKSTKLPDGLTYMDFKESQKSLGRLVLKKWTMKARMKTDFCPSDVTTYSNSDIVVSLWDSVSLIITSAESNPQFTVIPQELPIKGLTGASRVTVNKNDELIVVDDGEVKIFNKNYQLLNQFTPRSKPTCIAVDHNNLIAVGYTLTYKMYSYHYKKAEISLHKPDGSLIRTLPAPGIGDYLTTYKQRFIYTNNMGSKLVSVDYNGEVVFFVDIHQSGWPRGMCCYKDGSIYMIVESEIHQYSSDGKYIGSVIKDCGHLCKMTLTPAGDLVVTMNKSVQIYQHE